MTEPIGPGAFIAVTGASGVGKDTLLDAAHVACGPDVLFPRRAITRPAGPGEDYLPLTEAEFDRARLEGRFTVCWHAHGLDYGIPIEAYEHVLAGGVVVANVSRGAIEELRQRFQRLVWVSVTVSDEVRAARLRSRGRESSAGIAERLGRADPAAGRTVDYEIRNDGSVRDGTDALLGIIRSTVSTREEIV